MSSYSVPISGVGFFSRCHNASFKKLIKQTPQLFWTFSLLHQLHLVSTFQYPLIHSILNILVSHETYTHKIIPTVHTELSLTLTFIKSVMHVNTFCIEEQWQGRSVTRQRPFYSSGLPRPGLAWPSIHTLSTSECRGWPCTIPLSKPHLIMCLSCTIKRADFKAEQ